MSAIEFLSDTLAAFDADEIGPGESAPGALPTELDAEADAVRQLQSGCSTSQVAQLSLIMPLALPACQAMYGPQWSLAMTHVFPDKKFAQALACKQELACTLT